MGCLIIHDRSPETCCSPRFSAGHASWPAVRDRRACLGLTGPLLGKVLCVAWN